MPERLRRWLPALAGLVLFVAALEVLRGELGALRWHTLAGDVLATPASRLLAAAALTGLDYLVLTAYDLLAFAAIGKRLSRVRIVVASFLAYAVANNVGFAMLSGASVRYRFYARWGVRAPELARIVVFYSITFWLGLLALGGFSLLVTPLPSAYGLPSRGPVVLLGALLMAASLGYVATVTLRRRPLRLGRFELPLPRPWIAWSQLGVSALDWGVAAAALYVLLPAGRIGYLGFTSAFLAAQLLALLSHVPGGVGVFEGLMVLLLKPYAASAELLPALVVFRAVYYLLPLVVALVVLVTDEARQRRAHAARVGALLGRLNEQLTPRLLAVFVFLAGAVLLFSGATPAAPGRLSWLDALLPLGVIEVSHFLGSVLGAALLLVSQGIARRLDAAYYLASGGIALGIAASLLKGADYEEALLLGLVLLALRGSRAAFDRRAALLETRFSPAWSASVAAALAASLWLALFAFKHVEYSSELWWQFELHGQASRALRASVGAAVTLLLFATARLLAHAAPEPTLPSDADLEDAAAIIARQPATTPFLVFLRDKRVLFDETRQGFVMYGVQGRTWAAMGDPVGPPERASALIREFLERADDFGAVPVFYEVAKDGLHRYADFGLTFVKLGEEARVDLSALTLEGASGSRLRQAVRRLEKEGGGFRVLEPVESASRVAELEAVSRDWLAAKAGAEKGFSLGFFDRGYVSRFPVAVVESAGAIVAFANVWPGAQRHELSIDLMRYRSDAPPNVMEALLVHLMIWGKQRGYRWFALGMAPLSGFEASPVAPLWNRLGAFVYEHGEAVYNFQGLRAYKDKFRPVWEPRYLAYPGGLRLARILADISALVAGGYRRIFLK